MAILSEAKPPIRSYLIHAHVHEIDKDMVVSIFAEPQASPTAGYGNLRLTVWFNDAKKLINEVNANYRMKLAACENYSELVGTGDAVGILASDLGDAYQFKRRALPISWQATGQRTYAANVEPYDVIATELCLAHSSAFTRSLENDYKLKVGELLREAPPLRSDLAARDARLATRAALVEETATKARQCQSRHQVLKEEVSARDRTAEELEGWKRRLTIAKGALEMQAQILRNYKPSAESVARFRQEVAAHEADVREFERQAKAFDRKQPSLQARIESFEEACTR